MFLRIPQVGKGNRAATMDKYFIHFNHEYTAGRVAVLAETLTKRRINRNLCAAIHPKTFSPARDQEQDTDKRVMQQIADAIKAIISGRSGNSKVLLSCTWIKLGSPPFGEQSIPLAPSVPSTAKGAAAISFWRNHQCDQSVSSTHFGSGA